MPLPRHVRPYKRRGKIDGYRAVVSIGNGRRWYGPVRRQPEDASADVSRYLASTGRNASGITLGRAFDLLLVDLDRSGARPATEDFYRTHYRALLTHWSAEHPLAAITRDDVIRFTDKRRASGVALLTIWKMDVLTLRRLIGVALHNGLLKLDPLVGLRAPKIRVERYQALSAEGVAKIAASIRASRLRQRERNATIVEFLFATGLRRSELLRLKRDDVDLDRRVMHVDGKTGMRTIPIEGLGLETATRLCNWFRPGDSNLIGLTPNGLTTVFRKIPGLSPHALRHSFATDAVRRGVQPFVLATLLGHTSPKQSFRYYQSTGDDVRDAMRSIGGHGSP